MGGGGKANKIYHCIKHKNNKVEVFVWLLCPINLVWSLGKQGIPQGNNSIDTSVTWITDQICNT